MKNSTLKFANGDKYEGELKGKKKHGYGVFTWADGSTFRGDWKDDKKHGHATFTDANLVTSPKQAAIGSSCVSELIYTLLMSTFTTSKNPSKETSVCLVVTY